MENLAKGFYLLALVFLLLGLFFNFLFPNLPRLPGDLYIDKPGLKVYIPFTSSIILSVLLSILLNILHK